MDPWVFWEYRPVDYARKVRGYYIREERRWLHTREILASLHNAFAAEGKAKSAAELVPLEYFDKQLKPTQPAKPRKTTYSPEEVEQLKRRFGMIK
jgi:hypothetical protein